MKNNVWIVSLVGMLFFGCIQANGPVLKALQRGDKPELQRLIAAGVDINEFKDDTSLLMSFIDEELEKPVFDVDYVKDRLALLKDLGLDINAHNSQGRTIMHYVADVSSEVFLKQLVPLLVEFGANVNASDQMSATPLFLAVHYNNPAATQAFVENGADVNKTDQYYVTPLHLALAKVADPTTDFPWQAVKSLISAGADLNVMDEHGETPLQIAPKIVRSLGSDPKTLIMLSDLFSTSTPGRPENLNAVLSLEQDDHNNAVTKDLVFAFVQRVPIICSSNLFHRMIMEYRDVVQAGLGTGFWDVFTNLNSTIVMLFPRYENGYSKMPNLVPSDQVVERFGDPKYADKSFGSDQEWEAYMHELLAEFERIFTEVAWVRNMPKAFYIAGHGETDDLVAGFPLSVLKKLFHVLNSINTQFVYILSCFSAGVNLVHMQKSIEQVIEEQSRKSLLAQMHSKPGQPLSEGTKKFINYPIVVQGATDTLASEYFQPYRVFFDEFDQLRQQSPLSWYFGTPKTKKPIESLITILYQGTYELANLPSIRFPGANTFFRALNVDDMEIITWQRVQRLCLASKMRLPVAQYGRYRELGQELYNLKQELISVKSMPKDRTQAINERINSITKELKSIRAEKKVTKPTLTCRSGIRAVQLFACDLGDITLHMNDAPVFISKIPGNAEHFIKAIKYDGDHAEYSIAGYVHPVFFSSLDYFKGTFGVSKKTWFIGQIEVPSKKAEGLVVTTSGEFIEGSNKMVQKWTYWYRVLEGDRYIYFKTTNDVMATAITREEYIAQVTEQFNASRALPEALYEATAGQESSETEEEAFATFMRGLGLQD